VKVYINKKHNQNTYFNMNINDVYDVDNYMFKRNTKYNKLKYKNIYLKIHNRSKQINKQSIVLEKKHQCLILKNEKNKKQINKETKKEFVLQTKQNIKNKYNTTHINYIKNAVHSLNNIRTTSNNKYFLYTYNEMVKSVPRDCCLIILSYLDVKDKTNLSLTCKTFYSIVNCNIVKYPYYSTSNKEHFNLNMYNKHKQNQRIIVNMKSIGKYQLYTNIRKNMIYPIFNKNNTSDYCKYCGYHHDVIYDTNGNIESCDNMNTMINNMVSYCDKYNSLNYLLHKKPETRTYLFPEYVLHTQYCSQCPLVLNMCETCTRCNNITKYCKCEKCDICKYTKYNCECDRCFECENILYFCMCGGY